MKKVIIYILGFWMTGHMAYGQTDAKAKAILTDVSRKFRSYDIVKVDFSYNYQNPQASIKQNQSGVLYLRSKQNKYKAVLPSQELISDGKNQWTYLKEDKEVQISEVEGGTDALNPAQIFTIYEKGFKYIYTGESKLNGRACQNIELVPLATRSFSKIKLRIDKANKQIYSFAVYDKNGNIYTYTVNKLTPNIKASDALFSFDASKYPGVDVVDLR